MSAPITQPAANHPFGAACENLFRVLHISIEPDGRERLGQNSRVERCFSEAGGISTYTFCKGTRPTSTVIQNYAETLRGENTGSHPLNLDREHGRRRHMVSWVSQQGFTACLTLEDLE
jgi:hypothetical protein